VNIRDSRINYFHSKYSHVYIEKEASQYPLTLKILKSLPQSNIIMIDHYKDVFSRDRQSYDRQSKSQNLILAVKKHPYLYKGSPLCHSFGYDNFFYTSTILNCPYGCSYCFLKGMVPSGNLVIFVNYEDFFSSVAQHLNRHPVYLSLSYDTDLMALEPLLGYGEKWFWFSYEKPNLTIELRTKSTQINFLKSQPVHPRLLLGWTLSPQSVIDTFEKGAPSLKMRIEAIRTVILMGYRVRLCFDPLLYFPGWENAYKEMIDEVFNGLSSNEISDISIGAFRMPKDYLKRFRRSSDDLISSFPYVVKKGIAAYPHEIEIQLIETIRSHLLHYIEPSKIFTLHK